VTRDGILVANYDTVYTYDDEWNVQDTYSHPLFVGTHEVDWDGRHLYMAATGIDAILRYDPKTREVTAVWDPHVGELADEFGLKRRAAPIDGSVDYRVKQAPGIDQCHINGVTRRDDVIVINCGLVRRTPPLTTRAANRVKRTLGLERRWSNSKRLHGESAVVQVNGSAASEVLLNLRNHDMPTHNGQLLADGRIILNDSTNNTFRVFSPDGARELHQKEVPGTWLRGLEPVDERHVLLGTAPGTIVLLDFESGEIVSSVQLSENPHEAVHGLCICPDPPDRL